VHRTIQVSMYPGEEGWYVAEAAHLPVVTQGRTYDETIGNVREALALFLEGGSPEALGILPGAPVIVTMEMAPVNA
jgi:predicted RNase H-like HicB family nuclease